MFDRWKSGARLFTPKRPPWWSACLALLLASVPAGIGAVRAAHGDARLCRLVERTPWGFDALEKPPTLEGFTDVSTRADIDLQQAWAFGCAALPPSASRAL